MSVPGSRAVSSYSVGVLRPPCCARVGREIGVSPRRMTRAFFFFFFYYFDYFLFFPALSFFSFSFGLGGNEVDEVSFLEPGMPLTRTSQGLFEKSDQVLGRLHKTN